MTRLVRQMGQAAEQAVRHKENNDFIDLKNATQATTKIAFRRFARRELRPIITRQQLKKQTEQLHAQYSLNAKQGGCFDTRGNPIPCPMGYQSYESIVSVKMAFFDASGKFVYEIHFNINPNTLIKNHRLIIVHHRLPLHVQLNGSGQNDFL